jgi:hypothetical protein
MNSAKLLLFLSILPFIHAQDLRSLIDWDKLLPKAVQSVNVNLDGSLLGMAGRFLSGDKPDEARVKKLIGDIKGIYVRSLKFEKDGEYSLEDVEKARNRLRAPEWNPVAEVRSLKGGGENAGVFIKTDGKQIQGIVVLAAEPRELTLVVIDGSIDPAQLRDLSGHFGIPKLDSGKKSGPKKNEDE